MPLALTLSVYATAGHFHSFLHIFAFAQPTWLTKFLAAFVPAFLGSGILFGVIYVLVMRAIRIDRATVEAWFESQRQRLQSGPVPIIERAQPVMIAALCAIYGRSPLRRLITSFVVGLLFTSVIFIVIHHRYKNVPAATRQLKLQLEQEADPVLYKYVTDSTLKRIFEQSQEMRELDTGNTYQYEYIYKGGIYDELRTRKSNFRPHLARSFFANSSRVALTQLLLIEGTYLEPGFQWMDSIFVFVFNVGLDFISVTIAITCLRRLGEMPTFRRAIVMFAYAVGGTLICASVAFLSYRLFFRGNPGFFWQAFGVLPLSLAVALAGVVGMIVSVVSVFSKKMHQEYPDRPGFIVSAVLAVIGASGIRYVWSYWPGSSLGVVVWRDLFSPPYVLAATTLVPATLTSLAFALMLVAKLTAEPARVLPEAYMTFMKEEVGGTQAAGIIVLLGLIIGAIVGLVWPAS